MGAVVMISEMPRVSTTVRGGGLDPFWVPSGQALGHLVKLYQGWRVPVRKEGGELVYF